ncbi:SRPBCC family protein [Geodermatophilus sp. CPCC 206100]|uniref:SRPBCC family protein n=1 Tax=Geodermatophilus sp. CPCC 206100 TaxID=3020054 RepID=UPI003B009872
MRDILEEVAAAARSVARRGTGDDEQVAVTVRRTYGAAVEDVWDAVTDPDRLGRWFAPVTGDLRDGGAFQVEGNVGGDIVRCERPHRLTLTWGGPVSVVDVRLRADGDRATTLELEHTVPVAIAGSGAGALYVGPGWDVGVLGLGQYLDGVVVADVPAWEGSAEVQRFTERAIAAWVEVVAGSGTASGEETAAAAEVARAQFTPDLLAGTAQE